MDGDEFEMKTWTYSKDGVCAVVSADSVEMAKKLLAQYDISAKNEDLIPLPVHHRHARVLKERAV
jgi:hypothetical protein